MNDTLISAAFGVCLLAGFFLVACVLVWLEGKISGWRRMAAKYSSGDRVVTGVLYSGVTGAVCSAIYRGTLTLHFNPDGFFLETMWLYRLGHPRMFIPWSEIAECKPCRRVWWQEVKLCLGNPVVGTLVLPAELVEKHAPRLICPPNL